MTTFLLETNPVDSGTNWYLLFFNASGQCWNGSAYATYTTNRDTFDMPMAEVAAGLGVYSLAMPALPAGETYWAYYKRIGGTPAHLADVRYKVGAGYCDGSNIVSQTGDTYAKVDTEVAAIKAKTDNLPSDPASAGTLADALAYLQDAVDVFAAATDATLGTISNKTNALPATPAAASDIPSASTVAAAVRTNLATELARIDQPISQSSSNGSGADQVTITINDQSGDPIADADVWITSDAAGTNVVAGTLQTNSDGEALFLLDDGASYYLWAQKDGQNSRNGVAFVAEAD